MKKVFLIFMALALLAPAAHAAEAPKMVTTKVTSDKMVFKSAANQVVFSGRVKVVNPDFTMTSERMTLFLSGSESNTAKSSSGGSLNKIDSGKVKTIVAEQNVVIVMEGGRKGTCDKATYTVADETLRMEGEPVLQDEGSLVKGETIIFNLAKQNMEVLKGVDVQISTPEKEKNSLLPGGGK